MSSLTGVHRGVFGVKLPVRNFFDIYVLQNGEPDFKLNHLFREYSTVILSHNSTQISTYRGMSRAEMTS